MWKSVMYSMKFKSKKFEVEILQQIVNVTCKEDI